MPKIRFPAKIGILIATIALLAAVAPGAVVAHSKHQVTPAGQRGTVGSAPLAAPRAIQHTAPRAFQVAQRGERRGAQRRASPRRAAPRRASPRRAAPRRASPRRAAPQRRSTQRRSTQQRRSIQRRSTQQRRSIQRRSTQQRRATQQRRSRSTEQRARQRRQEAQQRRREQARQQQRRQNRAERAREQRRKQAREQQRQRNRAEKAPEQRQRAQERRQDRRQDNAREAVQRLQDRERVQERRQERAQDRRQERRQERAQDRRQERRQEAAENRRERRQERRRERAQVLENRPRLRRVLRRSERLTAREARRGRFAARWHDRRRDRARRRAAHRRVIWYSPRRAWRSGIFAHYVPWYGAVYWPYAYSDLFYFTFWPYAYAPGFWAYAYDDFFDGIFFPYGAPYVNYAYAGPYYAVAGETTGTAAYASVPGKISESVERICRQPASGVTAWPFDRIEEAVAPRKEQQALLNELKRAAQEAAERFRQACPEHVPMTPTGRLEAMVERLQATLDAVRLVRPPLENFYQSLTDEQQARFNAIGPDIGKKRQTSRGDQAKAGCSDDKAGLTAVPIGRIEEAVRPTDDQYARLDDLSAAIDEAVETLEKACPDYIPLTPVGRMEVMQQRLEAMIEAARIVRPALEEFYASLTSEQKASFNRLGREQARMGG